MRVCRLEKDRRTLAHRLLFKTWESSNSLIFTFTEHRRHPLAGCASSGGNQLLRPPINTGPENGRPGAERRADETEPCCCCCCCCTSFLMQMKRLEQLDDAFFYSLMHCKEGRIAKLLSPTMISHPATIPS